MLQVKPLEGNDPEADLDVPLIQAPIHLVVPAVPRQKASSPTNTFRIDLSSAFIGRSDWLSADNLLMESLSGTPLGVKAVASASVRAEDGDRLKAKAEGNSALVLDHLAFSLNALKLRISGPASVEIDGKRLGFDLMHFLKENPILSGVLGLLNAAILLLGRDVLSACGRAAG